MLIKKFIYLLPFLFFAIVTSIVIFSWFRYGHLYGGGDVGLPSYDPTRTFEITKNIWWEASAPGTAVPHGLTSVPLQYFQSALQNLGLPPFLIQAVVFWILLFLMGFGMFLVGKNVFGRDKYYLAILAAVFYMFNPYMMVQVWHRFVHTTFFLAAALPFIYLFWRGWINRGAYTSLFLFLLTNFLASYLYGTLAFIPTILLVLIFIFLFEIFFPWKGIHVLKNSSIRFITGLVFWFLINSWWMLPSFNIAPAIFSTQHTVGENLTTLLSISQQAIIPYSLFGINPFYIYYEKDWGKVYDLVYFRILMILPLFLLISGFLKSLLSKVWLIWSILSIVALFLAKGAASPFGYLYIFGFSNFFALGILRNPFEKLGILLPFSLSILMALGVTWYFETFKKKFKLPIILGITLITIAIIGINLWPIWGGKIFGKYDKLAFVEVSQSYKLADDYIKNQNEQSSSSNEQSSSSNKDGRILHLPLTSGESATYYWRYGYNGVEPSQLLFKSLPSISHGFNVSYVDDALTALAQSFMSFPTDKDRIISLMQSFNIRFVILHKDIEWRGGYLYDPQKLEEILNKLEFFRRGGEFENLIVYELKQEFFAPKLRLSQNIDYLVSSKDNSYWPWLVAQKPADLLSPLEPNLADKLVDLSTEVILMPQNTYFYLPYTASKENVVDELPAVRILPDSLFYPLISLKEKISLLTIPQTDRFVYRVTLAGKRLVEVYKMSKKDPSKSVGTVLNSYQKLFPPLRMGIIERAGGGLAGGEIPLESIFARHLVLLDELYLNILGNERKAVSETRDKLITMLKSSQLLPTFEIKESPALLKSNRLVAKFEIPISGDYEILQAHQNSQSVYTGELKNIDLQVDDQIKNFSGTFKDNFISYGFITLSEGLHEISFHSALSNNLIRPEESSTAGSINQSGGEYEIISGDHDPSSVEVNIKPLTGGGWYQLSFDSWIKLGDKFKVQLIQDSDPEDPKGEEERLYSFNKTYNRDPYQNFWNNYSVNLHIRPATQKASIRLLIEPWDDCRVILVEKKLCESRQVRFPFEHPSSVSFKNIEMKRRLRNPLFLRATLPKNPDKMDLNNVNFVSLSPVSYTGQFNIERSQFLIFSESYHPGWKLKLNDGKREIDLSPTYIANLFANAYFIENPGKYKFILKFTPQDIVLKGIIISLVSWLGIITIIFWQRFKK